MGADGEDDAEPVAASCSVGVKSGVGLLFEWTVTSTQSQEKVLVKKRYPEMQLMHLLVSYPVFS